MANNIQVLDANGVEQTMNTTETGGVNTPHSIVDSGPISNTASVPNAAAIVTTSVTLLPANPNRQECTLVNAGTTVVYLGLGQIPTITTYHIALIPCAVSANDGSGGTYTSDMWKGSINAICGSTGTVMVVELT